MPSQRGMADFRLREVPHVGNISKADPNRGNHQLLGVLDFFRCGSHHDFAPQTSHFSRGGYRGITHWRYLEWQFLIVEACSR